MEASEEMQRRRLKGRERKREIATQRKSRKSGEGIGGRYCFVSKGDGGGQRVETPHFTSHRKK